MKTAQDYYKTKNHEYNHRTTSDEGTANFMASSGGFAQGLTNALQLDFNGDYNPTQYMSRPNWMSDVAHLNTNTNKAAQVGQGNRLYDVVKNSLTGQIPYPITIRAVDPLASAFPHMSPYAVFNNNPIRFTDPTGMVSDDFIKNKTTGQVEWRADVTSAATTPEVMIM